MATVSKWSPFDVALDITATAGTVTRISATQYTVKINASWETYYSGALTNYGMSATSGGETKTISAFGTNRSSGSGSFTGTYSISGNGSAQKTITVTFKNYEEDWQGNITDSATKSVTFNVTVPAWTSYKITYNANGGSGAPSSQTKWKNQTLTLSSTKPTRTGYSFLGWSTSSTATAATYSAGQTISASALNANTTLYAVWKANTYTVTYNANGGILGSVKTQTKTYGQALKLTGTATRENYNFKGWATSASSATVTYAQGASYTANAAVTLYAVWETAYLKPTVTNFSVSRCDASGNPTDEGANLLFKFNWSSYETITSILLNWVSADGEVTGSEPVTVSGTSGTVNKIVGNGTVTSEKTFTVNAIVTDVQSTTITRLIESMQLPFEAVYDETTGKYGVSFGKAAEFADIADFNYKILSRKAAAFANDKSIFGTDTDGAEYSALIPVTASGNTSLGHGLYKAGKGNTHIYGHKVQFYTNEGIYFNGSELYMNNAKCIWGYTADGKAKGVFQPQNGNGNTVVGYDNYSGKAGGTHLYGHDLLFGVSNIPTPGTFRPYLRHGMSVSVTLRTSGYVTNAGTEVHFIVPLTRPVIGSPTVTVTSGTGFTLRQGSKYTHGSSATASVTPTKYAAAADLDMGVIIVATFANTTNVTNNDSIGIYWNGTITFS